MRIEWTPRAIKEQEKILNFLGKRDPDAATRINASLLEAIERVVQFPYSGRVGRVNGTRECVFHKHYLFIYRVKGDAVEIMAVLHTSLLWPEIDE